MPSLFYPLAGIGKGRTLALRAVVSEATVVVRRGKGGCGGDKPGGAEKMTVFIN